MAEKGGQFEKVIANGLRRGNLMFNKSLDYENNVSSTEFLITIHFKQNSSWQGEIQWLNGKGRKMFFRSFLEMVMLMNEALDSVDEKDSEEKLRSWKTSYK